MTAQLAEHDLALLTIDEAAEVAGVRPGTVWSWINRHGLLTVRINGGPLLVSEAALLECEYQRRTAGRGRKRSA